MKEFKYRSKGTVDEWTTDAIQADSRDDAVAKLDVIYGIERDESGQQTNAKTIRVEMLTDEAQGDSPK